MLRDFAGKFILTGDATFSSNKGINDEVEVMGLSINPSFLLLSGLKSSLIKFDRFKFSQFKLDGVKFIDNFLMNYTTNATHPGPLKSINPRLFEI